MRIDDCLKGFNTEKELAVRKQIGLSERSVTYILQMFPDMECAAYQVDDYIIRGADKNKCDKLVVVKSSKDQIAAIFVELKGSDVAHAVGQLDATLSFPLFRNCDADLFLARIVSKRIPANTGRSVVERARVNFLKKYKCELKCVKPRNPDVIRDKDFYE